MEGRVNPVLMRNKVTFVTLLDKEIEWIDDSVWMFTPHFLNRIRSTKCKLGKGDSFDWLMHLGKLNRSYESRDVKLIVCTGQQTSQLRTF